jgi:drug/metabolite transporter (DMT)-like permease
VTKQKPPQVQTFFSPVIGAFILLVLLSGGASIAIKFSYDELPTFWGAALRFGSTTAILWLLVAIRSTSLPRGKALLVSTLHGALGIGFAFPIMYWGLERTPASLHQIIFSLAPLLTLFFAVLHRLETLHLRNLIGAIIAVTGIAIIFSATVSGDLSIIRLLGLVLAAALMAESSVLIKPFANLDPIAVITVSCTVGTAIIVTISAIVREPWILPSTAGTWWLLTYLSIGTTLVTFVLYLYVLKRWTASATAYMFVLIPLVTVILATSFAGERITWLFIIGASVVLVGVWLGALLPTKPKTSL